MNQRLRIFLEDGLTVNLQVSFLLLSFSAFFAYTWINLSKDTHRESILF